MITVQRCIIVDDEPAAHYVLANYIRQNPHLELMHQCYNGIEAMDYVRENPVDLMFLDIDMPEITGLELLKILPSAPKTILTTAYTEFALESYDYGVVDYLLKPIYFPRFLKAVERFLAQPPQEKTKTANPNTSITVKVDGFPLEIALDSILYAQSFGNYVKLHTASKTYLASTTTNELEKALPDNFMRIHKSYIVALDKIKLTEKDFVVVRDAALPIGITYKRELSERLNERE